VEIPQNCAIELFKMIKVRVIPHNENIPEEYIWIRTFAVAPCGPGPGPVRLILFFFVETLSYFFPVVKCVL
jgi:hypothetical protein